MASIPQQQPSEPRRRVEYTANFERKLDQLLENQTRLEVQMSELRAGIMPRHEIDAEIEKRVHVNAYLSDKTGIENRLKHLEDAPSGSWMRAGILMSSGIGCLGLLSGAIGILVSILIASHVIG